MNIPHMYIFDFNNIALTVVFLIISSIMAVEFSRQIKKAIDRKKRKMVLYSLLLALTFLLTHLFVIISAGVPFSTSNFYLFFLLFFGICGVGSYAALSLAQRDIANTSQYISTSLLIAASIMMAEYTAFYIIFREAIEIQPILSVMAFLMILVTSFTLIRFLMQITNEDIYEFVKNYKYTGSVLGGMAMGGIPYIALTSMMEISDGSGVHSFLAPFIYMAAANLLFMLVPDLFGEKLIMKNVQSHLSLFSHNPDSVFRVDLQGYILSVNKEAVELTGYMPNELAGLHFIDLIGGSEEEKKIRKYFMKVLSGETKLIETTLKRADSTYADVRITAVRIIVKNTTVGVFGIVRDITEQKKADKMIEYLAYHDELTNLPNRRNLEKVMASLFIEDEEFSLIYLDFDRFKRINDTFGHSFGDKILMQIGNKLSEVVPEECLVARIGGDEFAILVTGGNQPDKIANEIVREFQSPLFAEGMEFLITASIGISKYPEDTNNLELLLKYADMAMYKAKENGANHYQFFDQSMVDQNVNKFELENDLRNAINSKSLTVFYQPKYNATTNEITGAEALARWKHPRHGMIPPGVFIPIAEEANLIVPLERLIIRQVFSQLVAWKNRGFEVPRTSINISIIHFYQEDFVKFMQHTLKEYDLYGELIEIEVTESIMIKKEDSINSQLQALREIGIEVSIDDFGTGYSSLSYLSKLSVDRLKIDQSFISHSQENREIISTIVSMATNLKLKVIAEGVETASQIDLLKSLGCQEVQGYFYSPPLPSNEYETMMNKQPQET
ncbi:sensor domain-containing protein [Mesobacillus selenatarsenatis]|uniref:Diguanylate cyclase/phosphodiesterase (GGDEF & EAL domains) with PAS/PAC sensor(S) n=1 Tax=Mesobacillus selenatarsenatis (strain DSM 18680 / JCM 14380 / FERM P-15431 / SF-1) TaxID=1321606 RepID=A0A0A8X3S7_MESS1|nr:EAL domain-containing protein [Mesobacillus selenatarsenatis]GAM14640.1 diguanylate cyclase/phosphodiesterase (GGDEF & EAL domains) with PAS/PAC sensor(s) [Mesobacillus selenatarsenatis SF-1]